MATMKIGEVARQAGIRTSAIRFYESAGLLPRPPRVSGWRRYGQDTLEHLRVIQIAREVGFSIAEIRVLVEGFPKTAPPSGRWKELAQTKLPELDQIIQRAIALKYLIEAGLDCTCNDIALCINSKGVACRPVSKNLKLVKIGDIGTSRH